MSVFNRLPKFPRVRSVFRRRGQSPVSPNAATNDHAPHTLDHKLVYSLRDKKVPSIRQFKYLPQVLSKRQKATISVAGIVAALALLALGINFFNRNFSAVPANGGDYTGGLIGAPQYINPLLAQNDVDIDLSRLIFSGLMKYDNHLQIIPDLAERFEVSEDKKVYTFVLKENALWHDGEPLTVEDVLFTYESIQNSDFRSPLIISLRGVALEQIDERTIRFTLPQSYPSFLEVMTTGILPEHLWREIPPINANLTEYNVRPVGSGPWMFETLTKDRLGNIKTFNLKPHPQHHDKKPYLQHLTFKFYPDFVSAVDALKNHSVEGISFLPKELKPQLASQKGLGFYSFYLPQYTAIFFNSKKLDVLKEQNIREALALGIDKQRILNEGLEQEGEIINTPLLPENVQLPADQTTEYNPNLADQLLEKSGWKKISADEYKQFIQTQQTASTTNTSTPAVVETIDTLNEPTQATYRKNGDSILEITLTTVNHPINTKTAEMIKKQWENIGVKVNLSVVESAKITREVIKPRNYEILLFGIIVGSDADPFPFWHSSQVTDPGLNLAQFANRETDKLLENARNTTDTAKRTEFYTKFATVLAQEIPAVFLYNPTYTYVLDKKIKGLDINRINAPADRFNNINEWHTKVRWRWNGTMR